MKNYLIVSICSLLIGFVGGYNIQPQKEYPVKVEVCYQTKNYWYTNTIECDSVKGNTIYKDGLSIVNKNIVNVIFK